MDDALTEAQLEALHRSLLQLQASLRLALEQVERSEVVELDLPIGRLSRMDAMQQQAMAQAEQRRHAQRLEQVEAALERVADESFGCCRLCDELIPLRRLEARPEGAFCLRCQARLE